MALPTLLSLNFLPKHFDIIRSYVSNEIFIIDDRTGERVAVVANDLRDLKINFLSPFTGTPIPYNALVSELPSTLNDSRLWC